jgi:PAS domain S-box-containing protein
MRATLLHTDGHARAAAPQPRRIAWSLVLAVVAFGIVCTWLAARLVATQNAGSVDRAVNARANLIEYALRDRLLTYEAVLRAGIGLFQSSENVTSEEWRTFVEQLQLAHSYPGLQGLGFARRTRAANREASGDPDRDHTSIEMLEPMNARNRRALGFDMMSENVRRQAMERARDSGSAVLSGGVVLVQEITAEKQAGFLLYLPLYSGVTAPLTVEERRERLLGFVYCPFRAEDFLTTVLKDLTRDVQLDILDGDPNADIELLFRRYVTGAPQTHDVVQRELDVLGHRWLLRVAPTPAFHASLSMALRGWVWAIGATATSLLAILVWALARSREHLAARLAAEHLSGQRERYSLSVLENSLDAYVAIDADDRIIHWNRQAVAIFGWAETEARGLRLADTIVPERHRGAHLAALASFSSRPPKLVGRRVEMPARRRDGAELTVELSIVATSLNNQPVFVASMRDITEQLKQQRELAHLNATLEQRVGDRTSELAVANRELHTANAQLEAFAQNVSHDLRAPVRAIEGYARIVAEEAGSKLGDAARGHLQAVLRNARKMQRLIDDMLKLAFIGRQPMDKRMINLWALVLGVLGDLDKPEGMVIHARPDELVDVFADPNLLEHALRNLLSNAIKFSRGAAQPTITIGSDVEDGERVFFVRDNGVGFDKQQAGRLFQVFHRLHRDQEFEGTGVGLTIVKNVIERHGGRVWAEAEIGKGATFCFTLSDRARNAAEQKVASLQI